MPQNTPLDLAGGSGDSKFPNVGESVVRAKRRWGLVSRKPSQSRNSGPRRPQAPSTWTRAEWRMLR